jgi:antitoxin component YwqK of YwqJK toxin-antitoxin module
MSRRTYKTSIPSDAVEVVGETHADGKKKSAWYYMDGEKVGHRFWDEEGRPEFEYGMRAGVRHGKEYRFWDGIPYEMQPYRNGKLHGTGMQWSADGRLLVKWKLVHGTGMDIWCGNRKETLSEEHYWPRPGERGYGRDWNEDEKTIWREYYYVLGKGYHGIWREWNNRGRLRRGFPHFFVNGQRVTRRQYLKACAADPLLLPYRAEDDDPDRTLPAEYLRQRRNRR